MKILICEESEQYIETLINKIKSLPCDEDIQFESYTATPVVTRRIKEEIYDIAFIGGIINKRNGFELGRMLKEEQPDCMIFYVCDDYRYMHETFRAGAFQMLIKGKEKLLDSEFPRALEKYHHIHYQIPFYTVDGKVIDVIPAEMLYIETAQDVTKVISTMGRFEGHFDDLKQVKTNLIDYHFFQMHPRYFVNMAHIDLIRSGELRLDNGDTVPLSAMNKEVIDEAIQTFFGI